MARARAGSGLAMEVSLAIPSGSAAFWERRVADNGVSVKSGEVRRGDAVLTFADPHGLPIALHETSDAREFAPWTNGPVAPQNQIRGLHSVRLWERDLPLTASFLTGVLGFAEGTKEGEWSAFTLNGGGSGKYLEIRQMPDTARGAWGTGGVHHVAWRVADESTELAVRERVERARRRPTEVIDRFWFKSVYFLEPGGVLFELATEGPGFTVDGPVEELGTKTILPPWLEPQRDRIVANLTPLEDPRAGWPDRAHSA
jgi:glyoxalase family protein